MESIFRVIAGAVAALAGLFAPVGGMILCAVVFVAVDFVTGVAASRHRAARLGREWSFESRLAWKSVRKSVYIVVGIALSWLIDSHILGFANLRLANLFAGFVCGVELWSFLENGAETCDYPPFRWLKRFMKRQLSDKLKIDHDESDGTESDQ